MPFLPINAIAIGRRRAGVNWASYWATLISATVETAAPTHVVLTFPQPQTSLGAIDFTIAGRTINSASWSGSVLTLVMSTSFIGGDTQLVVTFVKSHGTVNVTDNVTQAELATYITGLITPLSSGQRAKLNTLITSLKTGLSITSLSTYFDVFRILAGETAESSLRNLAKNDHHATAVNTPTFTQFEGFVGDGLTSYIKSDYLPNTDKVVMSLNSASIGSYSRTERAEATVYSIGSRDSASSKIFLLASRIASSGNHDAIRFPLNCDDITTAVVNVITSNLGLFIGSRTANNLSTGYQNKTAKGADTDVTTSITNYEVYTLCVNNGGSPLALTTDQISMTFIGKGLTQTDVNIITDAFEAYMDANGKGVIV